MCCSYLINYVPQGHCTLPRLHHAGYVRLDVLEGVGPKDVD